MARLQNGGTASDFDAIFGRRPKYAEVFFASYTQIVELIDPVLFEIGRLRSAQLNGSKFDLALRFKPAVEAGLLPQKIDALPGYPSSPLFSEAERKWLDYVEQFTIQASAIDDDMCSQLVELLGEEQFALKARAQWAAEAVQRACAVLDIGPGDSAPELLQNFVVAE